MTIDANGGHDLFDGLGTPAPPAGLRPRSLAAARVAAAGEIDASGGWSILAVMRAQPAWSTALVTLLLAHLMLGFFLESRRFTHLVLPRDREVAAQPDLLRLSTLEPNDELGPTLRQDEVAGDEEGS